MFGGGVFLTSLLIFIIRLSICCWHKREQKQVTPVEPTNMPVIYEEILPRAQEEKLAIELNPVEDTTDISSIMLSVAFASLIIIPTVELDRVCKYYQYVYMHTWNYDKAGSMAA